MKNSLLSIILLSLIIACSQTDTPFPIRDGYYQGYFEYRDTNYWSLIQFEQGKYIEWPSGGAMFQKSMACLTVGKVTGRYNTLTFELDSFKFKGFPESCVQDMLLPGSYQLLYLGRPDSLVMTKGQGDKEITYYLKKQD